MADRDLDQAFWHESLNCLDNEKGRPSLTTVQALFLMFLHESAQARDATAIHYRYMAHDMYKRLKLDHKRPNAKNLASDPAVKLRWEAITMSMWALFSFDT